MSDLEVGELPRIEYWNDPKRRRRKHIRRLAWTFVLTATVLISARWGRAIVWHARQLYWQRDCAAYERPPSTIIDSSGQTLDLSIRDGPAKHLW